MGLSHPKRKQLCALLNISGSPRLWRGYLCLIDTTNKLIGEAEVDIRKVVKESPDGPAQCGALPGVGFILAYLTLVEIGDISRFSSYKKLCGSTLLTTLSLSKGSYAGLGRRPPVWVVPSVYQNGAKNYHGHLSKKANRYLRWGMIEAAQKAKVMDPFLRRKAGRIERKKGASVATAAVAHRLLVIVYRILKEKRECYSNKLRKNLSGRPVLILVARFV